MSEQRFIEAFRQAADDGVLIKCTLSKPLRDAPVDLLRIYVSPVLLKKGFFLKFEYCFRTRNETKNYSPDEAQALLGKLLAGSFGQANMITADMEIALLISPGGQARLSRKKITPLLRELPDLKHNREKKRLIDPDAIWLKDLGISTEKGEIRADSQAKWRQINKYLEVIQNLTDESPLPPNATVADLGSGKGYLTFALYDFLHRQGRQVNVLGIELRPPLVEFCNGMARRAGFERLQFMALDIRHYQPGKLDMLIALHACDTATDQAIYCGITSEADIIVAAPCCHKQVRKAMSPPPMLRPMLRHGVMLERQAEMLTDTIRALLLESQGYRISLFEFVSTEHTPKNVMITAVKRPLSDKQRNNAWLQVQDLKKQFGIKEHYLEKLLIENGLVVH